MSNPEVRARVKPPFAERISAYADERGLKDADAVRLLLARGLEAEQDPGPTSYLAESLALILAMGAAVLAPLSVPLPALWPFAVAYLVVALVAFAGVLWSRGVRPPRVPRPWRRSA